MAWTPFDIVGLYYWYATAYMLYMHQEVYSSSPVTQVDTGDLVGQVLGQQLGLKTGTGSAGDRPTLTSNTVANSYMIFGSGAIRHSIQNSEDKFSFFFEETTRVWTIAFKIRFHNANAVDSEVIIDSNESINANLGIHVIREVFSDTIKFIITDGAFSNILVIESETITDIDWHDIVIKSAGSGFNQVTIQVDDGGVVQSEYTGFVSQNMSFELTFGATASGASPCPCDIADLIILDGVITPGDLQLWRDFIQFPTMDPIVASPVLKIKGDITGSTGFNARVFPADSLTWTTTPVPVERSVGGIPGAELEEDDTIFDTFTSATVYKETQIEVDLGPNPPPASPGEANLAVTYESKELSVQTIDVIGRTTWVSDKTSRVVTKFERGNRGDDVATSETTGTSSKTFNRFTDFSAAKDSFDNTSVPIDGKVPSDTTRNVFSTFVIGDPPTLVRNTDPNFWGLNIDLRSIIAIINVPNWYNPGILVSPSCYINAAHASSSIGAKCWWVDNNGNLYSRIITDSVRLLYGDLNQTYVDPGFIDMALQFLDSPLPIDIPPAKLLPTTFSDQLPSVFRRTGSTDNPPYFGNGVPTFRINREKKLAYSETWSTVPPDVAPSQIPGLENIGSIPSERDPQKNFYIPLVTGDSGTAQCLFINGQTVVTQVYGTHVSSMIDMLNTIIFDFAPTETVSTIDLSSFTTFL